MATRNTGVSSELHAAAEINSVEKGTAIAAAEMFFKKCRRECIRMFLVKDVDASYRKKFSFTCRKAG
jgi:hypothetical protein